MFLPSEKYDIHCIVSKIKKGRIRYVEMFTLLNIINPGDFIAYISLPFQQEIRNFNNRADKTVIKRNSKT